LKTETIITDIFVKDSIQKCVTLEKGFEGIGKVTYTIIGGTTSSTYGVYGLDKKGCLTYKAKDKVGTDKVIVIACNEAGYCDTTIFIFNIKPKSGPNGCKTNVFKDETVNLVTPICGEKAPYCFQFPLDSIQSYVFTSNGKPYAGGFKGCNFDTTLFYNYFVLPGQGNSGPYKLDSWTVNGKVFKGSFKNVPALVDSMNLWDKTGQWKINAAKQYITGGNPKSTYGAIKASKPGTTAVAEMELNKNLVPKGVEMKFDTGKVVVIATHKKTGCADTLKVNVKCGKNCGFDAYVGKDTIALDNCDDKARVCTEIKVGDLLNYTITDNGVEMKSGFAGCNADTLINYSYFTLVSSNPDGPYKLKSWFVNGKKFSATFKTIPILIDSMNVWDKTGKWKQDKTGFIIKGGDIKKFYGPMIITTMKDQIIARFEPNLLMTPRNIAVRLTKGAHTVIFVNKVTACTDTVKFFVKCTPATACGNFILAEKKVLTTTNCALGAKLCVEIPFTEIANFQVTDNGKTFTGDKADCGGNNGTSLRLKEGVHKLKFVNIKTKCADSLTATVVCVKAAFRSDTIHVGDLDTMAVAMPTIQGKVAKLTNVCYDDSGEYVEIKIIPGTNYMICKGMDTGVERACIEVCNAAGLCDTMYMEVVVMPKKLSMPISLEDKSNVNQDGSVIINVLGNDKLNGTLDNVTIVKQPENGTATLDLSNRITYKPRAGFCGDDVFTYSICNENGCDSSKVKVAVYCDKLIIYTGFSPNNDGVNDFFTIQGVERFKNNKLNIFNRWGNQILEIENYNNDWDGSWNGQKVPDGTYFYIFDDGKGTKHSGYLQLQR
jgi:gliding motility-associated-like protein